MLTGWSKKKPDVQDLVQETFLKVLMSQSKYIDRDHFRSWTFTIMKNTFIDNYRHNYKKDLYFDQIKESIFINNTLPACSEDPHATYSALEIAQNIEQLHDKFRMPFNMYLNGYKYKEIADKLSMNIGTVKSRIFLSKKHLMVKLNK